MWFSILLLTLYMHKCISQEDYIRPEINYEIAGIFDIATKEQRLAFVESIAKASVGNKHLNAIIVQPTKNDSFSVWKELCSNVTEAMRPVAIFGPQNAISDRAVREQCVRAQIPHLQAAWQPFDPDSEVEEEEEGSEDGEEEEAETEDRRRKRQSESEDQEQEEKAEGPQFKNISINFYPDSNEIALAFAQLLKYYKWEKFAVLYEDDFGLLRVQKILANYTSNHPVFVRRLDPNGENHMVFKELKKYHESRIIIDCHVNSIMKYINISSDLGLVDHYQHYLLLSLDAAAHAKELMSRPSNITWMSLSDFDKLSSSQHYLYSRVTDWTYERVLRPVVKFDLESLMMVDMANHVIESLQAVIQSNEQALTELPGPENHLCNKESEPWPYGAALQDKLLTTKSKGVTGDIQFDPETGNRIHYTLYVNEIYGNVRKTIARWNSTTQDMILDDSVTAKSASNRSMNKHFIIISRKAEPYFLDKTTCEENDEDCGSPYEGFVVDLVKEIFRALQNESKNYTYEFQHDPEMTYKNYDPKTKKWGGLIGKLLDKKADLAVSDMTITEERKKVVDFSVPFMSLGISILFTTIEPPAPEMFSFLNPYSFEVWMYIATAYCVVSIVLFVCARISPPDWENPQPCDKDPEELENIWNFKNCTWLTMGSIMTQGCDILPKGFGTRWVCSMWWFFAVIVCQTYIAQLSAAMTYAMDSAAINSVEDLAKQTKVRYGAIETGSTLDFFKNSKDKMYRSMYENMDANNALLVKSNEEGVKRVLTGRNKYAFFMESTTIDYKLKRDCRLRKVGNLLDSKDYGIAMPPNSPFRKDINSAILKLKEDTTLDRIKNKWWNEKYDAKNCEAEVKPDDVEGDLEVKHLYGAFVVLIVGLFMSLFVTAAEFFDEVRNIVVKEKITHKEAFIKELRASLNFSQHQKPVQRNPSRAPSVASAKSQLENKQARRAMVIESFMDLEKITQ